MTHHAFRGHLDSPICTLCDECVSPRDDCGYADGHCLVQFHPFIVKSLLAESLQASSTGQYLPLETPDISSCCDDADSTNERAGKGALAIGLMEHQGAVLYAMLLYPVVQSVRMSGFPFQPFTDQPYRSVSMLVQFLMHPVLHQPS